MKKLILIVSILISGSLYTTSAAQNISININLNNQPAWGPTGYDYVGYYYFPDLNIYFDVNNSLFYYLSGSRWISNQYLPDKYRKYDLYSLYKVVINDSNPWNQNKNHKKQYSSYKGDKTQTPIRYSNDSRYNDSRSNNKAWVDTNRNNNNVQKPSNQNGGNKQNVSNQNNNNSQRPTNQGNGGGQSNSKQKNSRKK